MDQTGLRKVVENVGGFDAFRQRVGVSRRTLFNWLSDGVPPSRLPAVTSAVGATASDLRPDLFPAPTSAATLTTPAQPEGVAS